jgi:hypothetical protein
LDDDTSRGAGRDREVARRDGMADDGRMQARSTQPGRSVAAAVALSWFCCNAWACSGTKTAAGPGDGGDAGHGGTDAGAVDAPAVEAGADSGTGGGDSSSSACVPAIPQIVWTSPYAAWSRGVPTDKAFFPIAVWLQGSWHATELSQLGVNIYVGNNAGTDPMAASDLATIKALGMYAIIGQDSVGLASIDDPTIIGWWMTPDEPDNAQSNGMGGYGPPVAPSTLVTQYQAYKAADPTRPIWLGLGQGVAYDAWEGRGNGAPPESQYVPASDIVAFDIYPYNNCGGDPNEQATCGQFWLNAFGVDRLHMWSNRGQAVWTDFETTIISAGTTTGPTPAETVSEVWLSLIHGANGVVYFLDTWQPSFREDGIFADPAMVTAVTALDKQILELAPELNSATLPGLVTTTSSDATVPIDSMVKAGGTSLDVFSAVSRTGTATGSFAIQGMTGNGTATVIGESRTIPITAGKFSDAFAANGVHIYQVDLSMVTCP